MTIGTIIAVVVGLVWYWLDFSTEREREMECFDCGHGFTVRKKDIEENRTCPKCGGYCGVWLKCSDFSGEISPLCNR